MGRRRTDPENTVGLRAEEGPRALPLTLPDPAHLRIHDAVRRRASDVGGNANGAQRLDDDRQGIWALDASRGASAGSKAEQVWSGKPESTRVEKLN